MKKLFTVLGLVLILGVGSAFVYADGSLDNKFGRKTDGDYNYQEEMEEWHQDRMERRKEDLNRAVEEGRISKEESKTWEEHYDYMDKFHKENGHMKNGWGCHGGRRSGRGSGMMRMHRRGY